MLLIIVLAVLTGIGGTKAVEHLSDAPFRQLLIEKAELVQGMAENRLETMREHFEEIKKRAAAGMINAVEEEHVAIETAKMEIEVNRAHFDLMEVRNSGSAVRNDLSAPLVKGRDYVAERLELDILLLQQNCKHIQIQIDRTEARRDVIAHADSEIAHLNMQMEHEQTAIRAIEKKIRLRTRFLAGELSADDVELLSLLSEAEARVKETKDAVIKAQRQLAEMERLSQRGLEPQSKLKWARMALQTAETDARLAELDLRLIQRRLQGKSKAF